MNDAVIDLALPCAQPAACAQPVGLFWTMDRLLRDASGTLARIRAGEQLPELARAALATLAITAAVFGGVLGAHRGGLQVLYAAIKLPVVLLFTAALCAPALTALNAALGRPADLRRDLALFLVALARVGLALAAQVPFVYLASGFASYHQTTMLVVLCCAGAGLVGLAFLAQGLRASQVRGSRWASAALLLVFGLVGAQMSWTLRPWLLRPRTPEPVFMRQLEGSFFEAVGKTLDSASGTYTRDSAPLPGSGSDLRAPGEAPR